MSLDERMPTSCKYSKLRPPQQPQMIMAITQEPETKIIMNNITEKQRYVPSQPHTNKNSYSKQPVTLGVYSRLLFEKE